MNKNEVLKTIKDLASSQGFYGRLLRALEEADENARDEWLGQFSDCKDSVDVILKIEG